MSLGSVITLPSEAPAGQRFTVRALDRPAEVRGFRRLPGKLRSIVLESFSWTVEPGEQAMFEANRLPPQREGGEPGATFWRRM